MKAFSSLLLLLLLLLTLVYAAQADVYTQTFGSQILPESSLYELTVTFDEGLPLSAKLVRPAPLGELTASKVQRVLNEGTRSRLRIEWSDGGRDDFVVAGLGTLLRVARASGDVHREARLFQERVSERQPVSATPTAKRFVLAGEKLLGLLSEWRNVLLSRGSLTSVDESLKTLDDVKKAVRPAVYYFRHCARLAAARTTMENYALFKETLVLDVRDAIERTGNAAVTTMNAILRWTDEVAVERSSFTTTPRYVEQEQIDELVFQTPEMHEFMKDESNFNVNEPHESTSLMVRANPTAAQAKRETSSSPWLSKKGEDALRKALESGAKSVFGIFEKQLQAEIQAEAAAQGDPNWVFMKSIQQRQLEALATEIPGVRQQFADNMFDSLKSNAWTRRSLGAVDGWVSETEEDVKEWGKGVTDYVQDLFTSERESAKRTNEAATKAELAPGEETIVTNSHDAASAGRAKELEERRVKLNEGVVVKPSADGQDTYDVKTKMKPSVKVGKDIIDKLGVTGTLTLSKGATKHVFLLSVQVTDPFGTREVEAKASVESRNERYRFKAEAVAIVGGTRDNGGIREVRVNVFAGYDDKNLKTGIFVSALVPFQERADGSGEMLPTVIKANPYLHYDFDSRWSMHVDAKVQSQSDLSLMYGVQAALKYRLTDASTLALVGSHSKDQLGVFQTDAGIEFAHDFDKFSNVRAMLKVRERSGGLNSIDTRTEGFFGVQFTLRW